MQRLLLATMVLAAVGASTGCRDAENSPRAAYARLRQAILEESEADRGALLLQMHPTIRRAYRDRIAGESEQLETGRSGDELVLTDLRERLGNALRRDWVERSEIDVEWSDASVGACEGVQMVGPDRARVRTRIAAGGGHDYRFALTGGRWWWRPDLPVQD